MTWFPGNSILEILIKICNCVGSAYMRGCFIMNFCLIAIFDCPVLTVWWFWDALRVGLFENTEHELDRAARNTIPLPAELCMELFTLLRIFDCSMSIFDSPDDLCEFHSVKWHESSHNLLLQRLWKRVNPHMEHPIVWITYFSKEGNIWKNFIWLREIYIFN